MAQNDPKPQNFVKMIHNIEFEVKFDKNHNKLAFSMVFTDLDTCLIDTSKILLNVHDPKLYFLNVFLMIFMVTLSVKLIGFWLKCYSFV